jgi:hypothetical protein
MMDRWRWTYVFLYQFVTEYETLFHTIYKKMTIIVYVK